MLRSLIRSRIQKSEREIGVPLDYLRAILDASLGGFLAYARIFKISNYRKTLPKEAYHLARLVATQAQDCGTCVQMVVNMARKDGVGADRLRAVLDGKLESLPEELSQVVDFTRAVVAPTWDEGSLRDALRQKYGEAALVELAMAIGSAQFYPLTKRALGHATSCAKVSIAI